MATKPRPKAPRPAIAGDPSMVHLRRRLAVLELRVAAAVERRRSTDPNPDDRFRGLYISDDQVDSLLAAPKAPAGLPPADSGSPALGQTEAEADLAEKAGGDLRLRRLARAFGLDGCDVEILLVALAPDLDPRFERLYGYLHDDVTRRRASTGLALELCGTGWPGRRRVDPGSPLVAGGLLLVEEPDRPFLTRPLRVPDRVAWHLLGDDATDPVLEPLITPAVEGDGEAAQQLERALRAGVRLAYVRERTGAAGTGLAAAGLARAGLAVLALDLSRLEPTEDLADLAQVAAREARLVGAGIVAGPVETVAERRAGAVRRLAEARCPVVMVGRRSWDPAWSKDVPLLLDAPLPTPAERASVWLGVLNGDSPPGTDPAAATLPFRLTPEQVHRAADAARLRALADARPISPQDLQAGARAQNAAGLERLARRIEPRVGWDDLVLPPAVLAQLRGLAGRARHRDRVLDEWGMGARSSKGRAVTALFAGDSGTGKTMSAEVLAGDLGLDLYVIDLSSVVDKYVGETEKNLDRIFAEADRINGVLLFDEADAIFGKRSDVKDAHDRYANVEVAYLLQRMELFDGLAILTTNLRANVDDAFTRRLDAIVGFPLPEEDDRRRLWAVHLRPSLPQADDLDLDFLARAFKLSGGSIRNIALTAAYLAAASDRPVEMADLIRATEAEYHKLGHLCVEAEFGPWFPLLAAGERRSPSPGAEPRALASSKGNRR